MWAKQASEEAYAWEPSAGRPHLGPIPRMSNTPSTVRCSAPSSSSSPSARSSRCTQSRWLSTSGLAPAARERGGGAVQSVPVVPHHRRRGRRGLSPSHTAAPAHALALLPAPSHALAWYGCWDRAEHHSSREARAAQQHAAARGVAWGASVAFPSPLGKLDLQASRRAWSCTLGPGCCPPMTCRAARTRMTGRPSRSRWGWSTALPVAASRAMSGRLI